MTPDDLAAMRPLLVAARRGRTFTVQAKWALERYIEDHGGEVVVMETLLREVDRLAAERAEAYETGYGEALDDTGAVAEAVTAERARIRAAVEALPAAHVHEPAAFCLPAYCPRGVRAAVLALIDGGES